MNTKEDFHKWIDTIQDEEVLRSYFDLIKGLHAGQTGHLWNELSEAQQQELLIAFNESTDPGNLRPHDSVTHTFEKWLKK